MKLGIVGEHGRVMTAIVGLLAILRVVQSSAAAGNIDVERRMVT
jgi:uncharacterized membrane protein